MADYGEAGAPAETTSRDATILKASRDGLKLRIEAEQDQRALMLGDLKFATLDQWPEDLRAKRKAEGRPCLTSDHLNQYLTQVSNDMSANRPSVKARPEDSQANPETAKIFDGRIRHIEDRSSAHIAYQTAGDLAVTIGLGFFRVTADYISPDSFQQELLIKRINDTFSVYLGAHIMPDGSDTDEGWVIEEMALSKFKRDYPKAKVDPVDFAGLGVTPSWRTSESVMVCEYFYKEYVKRDLLFLADGTEIYKEDYERLEEPRQQIIEHRETQEVTVRWCRHSGCEMLEKRDLKGKYIPIVEVVGKEKTVEGKRVLWGLTRPAIDSLTMLNYWLSALTETMALAPKTPFIGAVGQFATDMSKWTKANVNNYAMLQYDAADVNGVALPPPRRQDPIQMDMAKVQMIAILENNVKASLGMYKASVGDTESQQSGRAILALKKESDTGTAHFGENQALAVAQCGRILVDLIPHYTDTKQIIRIIGEDGKPGSVAIDPEQKEAMREVRDAQGRVKRIFNLSVGKYGVTVTVGPGYTTSRQEASTVMTELANSAKDPVSAAIMRYGAVKNSDFYGSEEILHMLKATLPPQVLTPEEGQEPIPAAAIQKIQALTQSAQVMQQEGQKLLEENQQLKAGAQIDLAKVTADHDAKLKAMELDQAVENEKSRLARERFAFDKQLEIDKTLHAIDLDERRARAANNQQMEKLAFERQCREQDDAHITQTDVVPKLTEANSKGFAQMQAVLEAILQATLNPPPRQVSIGALQKDRAGMITGARIEQTPAVKKTLQ